MTVATFRRVIPARLPALRPVKIDEIPLHASFAVEGDEADVRGRLERFFANAAGRSASANSAATEWSFVDKHNWARRGVLVAHVGFVIIAAGTTMYWATGLQRPVHRALRNDRDDSADRRDGRARAVRVSHRSRRHQERHRLPADRLRLARRRHREGRYAAARRHPRQPALRRRRREDLSSDVRIRRHVRVDEGRAAGRRTAGDPAQGGRGVRDPRARRARSSTVRSSARSTVVPEPPAPTRGPTIPASSSKPSTATSRSASVLVPLGKPLDLGAGFALDAAEVYAVFGLSVPLRSGHSARPDRRDRAAARAVHLVLLLARPAVRDRHRSRAQPGTSVSPRRP